MDKTEEKDGLPVARDFRAHLSPEDREYWEQMAKRNVLVTIQFEYN